MYALNEFKADLRSFICTHAEIDVDVKIPPEKESVNGHIHFYTSKDLQNLTEKFLDNFTIIENCSFSSEYISLWLKKELWIAKVLTEILTFGSQYGENDNYKDIVISVNFDECNDLVTRLRITLLKNAIQNLAKSNGSTIGSNGLNLLLSKHNKGPNVILCGSVVCNITEERYKRQKYDTIAKMCANRIESDIYPMDIISKLCHISIVYEFLSVRHNKVVNTECNRSNKDNGIFIMYNYSRLCQIWAAYVKGVMKNDYERLPDINAINFGLLTKNEEWFLIFNFLSVYPSIIQESVKHLMTGSVDIHKLCKFLMEMSSAVSLFYHKHHVLSDPIPSLLPTMYARLYLVKMTLQVYKNAFKILGIEAVHEM